MLVLRDVSKLYFYMRELNDDYYDLTSFTNMAKTPTNTVKIINNWTVCSNSNINHTQYIYPMFKAFY